MFNMGVSDPCYMGQVLAFQLQDVAGNFNVLSSALVRQVAKGQRYPKHCKGLKKYRTPKRMTNYPQYSLLLIVAICCKIIAIILLFH